MNSVTESKFIDVRGKRTQITIGGSGPALLYLHSAGGEVEWTRFHEMLAQYFTVYLPAHPGFGDSRGLEDIHSITDYAWHYVDLLDVLELETVPVVGFSLGGWTAMELAILRPERISKMLLVNSAGIRISDAPMGELFSDDIEKLKSLLFYDPNSPVIEEAMPLSYEDNRILMWLKAREATARVGWNPYLHNPRLPDHLFRIPCPVRILWGNDDHLLPVETGKFLVDALPNATLEIFEKTGHMLPYEQAERFVEEVRNFLID